MATDRIKTKYGTVELFRNNPRVIRAGQFDSLTESVERHPEFLVAQKIVVWQVPTRMETEDGEKCPFVGQEGKLIVLSGNQRVKSLLALGKGEVADEWVCEAKGSDGQWWPWRDAEVFLNLANSPAGVSGDFDYEKLQSTFDEFRMKLAGIDFSNFTEALAGGTMEPPVDEDGQTDEEKAETDDLMGEKSEELKDFIAEREKTRNALKEVAEFGFYLLLVFEDGFEQKADFISKAKMFGGTVRVDETPYLCLVFESYQQKADFLDQSGLRDAETEEGIPALMFGMFCDGRAFAKRMGIELKETGLHNRRAIVDNKLKDMAMDPMVQKSEAEIQEEIFERLKKERRELGMSTGRGGVRGKKKGSVAENADGERKTETGEGMYVAEDAFEG